MSDHLTFGIALVLTALPVLLTITGIVYAIACYYEPRAIKQRQRAKYRAMRKWT